MWWSHLIVAIVVSFVTVIVLSVVQRNHQIDLELRQNLLKTDIRDAKDELNEINEKIEAVENLFEAFNHSLVGGSKEPKYKYPRIKFVDENSTQAQIEHIKSEIAEVENAKTFQDYWEELCDLEHSVETLIRISAQKGMDVDFYRAKVIEKNTKRKRY